MTTDTPNDEHRGEEPLIDLTDALGASSSSVVPAHDVEDTEVVLAPDPDDTEQAAPRLLPPHPAD
jgi:hypothetical protein